MLPDHIASEEALDQVLTRPQPRLVRDISAVQSPLLILGAGGKMGPSLAVLARRAAREAGHALEVIAASRFSDPAARRYLEFNGVRTLSVDLMDPAQVRLLPETANILYLVGLKFGTTQNPAATWAANTLIPAQVCLRYPHSRIAALSSGAVYPLTPVANGGALETEPLTPLGEYANACVARERIFEFFSRQNHTPLALIRLFYAVELRYGVLVDLALKIQAGQPVDLSMGYLNWIWQGDANELILRSLALAQTPPQAYNLTNPAVYSVRELAGRLAELMARPVTFSGGEAPNALLGNPASLCELLGQPAMPPEYVLRWTAAWVQRGGRLLGKPTHFEVRDGRY